MVAAFFITRKEFDKMIDADSKAMEFVYPELTRKWSLSGVLVTAKENQSNQFDTIHKLYSKVCDR
jgi:hypothetical protein